VTAWGRGARLPGMRATALRLIPLVCAALLAGCPSSKKASCPAGQTDCGGICFDLTSDPGSCGACLNPCATGASCVASACRCPAGQVACGGACVDTLASDLHCGGCDQPCGTGTCTGGACDCGFTTTCPSPGAGDPRCASTQDDPANCGSCGTSCRAAERCIAGGCKCEAPRTDCPTGCFNLASDTRHCGKATDCPGIACPAGATCEAGTCTCPGTRPDTCGAAPGTCVDLAGDTSNCGLCGRSCATGGVCIGGGCSCPAARPNLCGSAPGACVDFDSDPKNCGACAAAGLKHTCATGQTCQAGFCCEPDRKVCGSGDARLCCPGGCCPGGTCQVPHDNGLGQTYFSCDPLDTYTHAAALAAAAAWNSGAIVEAGLECASCLCLQTASQAAVWCYGDSLFTGKVALTTIQPICLCPTDLSPAWH